LGLPNLRLIAVVYASNCNTMRKLLPLLLILTALQTQAQAQCDASFSVAVSGATAQFISDTTRPGLLHRWHFGDGVQGVGPVTSHTYNAPGVYQVLHFISDSLGLCNDSAIKIVTISFQTSCQASFVYQKDSIFANKYHFFSTSTASGGSINSHQWTINGNFVSSAQGFSQTLPQGSHLVCLTITTTSGCSSSVCDSVQVDSSANCDLNADFAATVRRDTVFLQAVASGVSLMHTWKFGDGQQGVGQNVMHRYNAPGTYVITHYVTDSATNCIDSAKRTVTITAPVTCKASFTAMKDSVFSNRYHFFSTSTSSGGSISSYNWTINGNFVSSAQGFSQTLSQGTHLVCLTINTTAGCSSTFCDSLQVDTSANCDLNADFVATVRRDTVFLQAVDSGFSLAHIWKFGDGQQGFGQNIMHRYIAPGTYVITHYVVDSATNCIDSAKRTVTITAPVTCRASFTARKDSVLNNRYHFFSTSTSSGGGISSYKWTINGQLASTSPGFSKTFPTGKYLVCLTIGTTAGCSSTACDSIQVGNPQPRCQASFVVIRDSVHQKKYRFFSTSTAQPGPIEAYRWTLNGQVVSKEQAFSANLKNGVHQVCLTIKTSAGCVSSKCENVVVKNDSIPVNDSITYITSFPNPVAGSAVNLQLTLDKGAKVKLTVYNSRGNIVHKEERVYSAGYNRMAIPVDGLQRGQYFIDIQYDNTRKRSVFQKL
jgi:PKD repeat protein